jgi:hypothetical protein
MNMPDVETAGLHFMQCLRWLEQAQESTTDRGLRLLLDDVIDDLWSVGSIDGELGEMVLGALASVASALEVNQLLLEMAA